MKAARCRPPRATARQLAIARAGAARVETPSSRCRASITIRVGARLAGVMGGAFDRRHIALARLAHRLASQSPQARLSRASQKLESLEQRLQRAAILTMQARRERLATLRVRLSTALSGRAAIRSAKDDSGACAPRGLNLRLRRALGTMLERRGQRLAAQSQLLGSLGYRQVLGRGLRVGARQ